ncbi:Inositol-tetrakisphosphate 1-kinase [Halotydeus destructor]|nr:Inositol-tetrakisphosphate 1-kinase [Halotydeus destructor]
MADHLGSVGFWWSEKKAQKLDFEEFRRLLSARNLKSVKIDLDKPLEPQGPFDVIVHKLSDVAAKADKGDVTSLRQVSAFEEYVKSCPEMILIDNLEGVRVLMDRYKQYKVIDDSDLGREDVVFTPPFVELKTTDISDNLAKLKEAKVNFPFVCKPLMAHGSSYAHQMSIIFREEGLKEVKPPCVAQSFINHNARLFKVFVMKDKYNVIERPSLKNFKAADVANIHFDSHDISKPNSSSFLTELDDDEEGDVVTSTLQPERVNQIVKTIRNQLGLYLFGIDIIIEQGTGRYAIIDINLFPGYDGVDNFLEELCDLIVDEIAQQRVRVQSDSNQLKGSTDKPKEATKSLSPATGKSNEVQILETDSGIDTSDSCDEKKNKPVLVKAIKRQHSKNATAN